MDKRKKEERKQRGQANWYRKKGKDEDKKERKRRQRGGNKQYIKKEKEIKS